MLALLLILCCLVLSGCQGGSYARRTDNSRTLYIGVVGSSFPVSYMPWFSRDGIAPTIASGVCGAVSAALFGMVSTPYGAGMGTSGLVGQFGAWQAMVTEGGMEPVTALIQILIMHVVAPAVLSLVFHLIMKKLGWVKDGDMQLIR